MKWKALKLFLPLLLLGFVVPMIMPGADGKPVMSYQDWLPDEASLDSLQRKAKRGVQVLSEALDSSTEAAGGDSPELFESLGELTDKALSSKQVYKWKDEFGQWHFTDDAGLAKRRGSNSSELEQHVLSYPANAIPAPSPEQVTKTAQPAPAEPFEPSLKNIPKVMDEANRVKELLEQRYRETEQL